MPVLVFMSPHRASPTVFDFPFASLRDQSERKECGWCHCDFEVTPADVRENAEKTRVYARNPLARQGNAVMAGT